VDKFKQASLFFEGQEGYWNGNRNPYEKGSPEFSAWEKGWHSENLRECVYDDYDGEE
jgi:hypothetical protein